MPDPIVGLPTVRTVGPTRQSNVSGGAGARAMADAFGDMADAASSIRQQLQPRFDERARQQGQEAAQEAATAGNEPEFRDVWSREDAVYNNALEAGYMANFQVEAADRIDQISRDNPLDPDAIRVAGEEWLAEIGRSESRLTPSMSLEVRSRLNRAVGGAAQDLADSELVEAQQSLELRLTQIEREQQTLLENDPQAPLDEEYAALTEQAQSVIETLVANPAFGWSQERGAQQLDSLARGSEEVLAFHQIDAALGEDMDVPAAIDVIDRIVDAQGLSTQERIAMTARMRGHLQGRQVRHEAAERRETDAEEAQEEIGRQNALAAYADIRRRAVTGEATDADLDVLDGFLTQDFLTTGEFNAALNAITAPRGTDRDPGAETALRAAVRDMSIPDEDFERMAFEAARGGAILPATYTTLVEAREARRDGLLRHGVDHIESRFSQGQFNFNGDLAAAEESATNDLRDWYERALQSDEPPPTRADVREESSRIATQYGQQIPLPGIPRGVAPAPRFVGGEVSIRDWSDQAQGQAFEAAIEEFGLPDTWDEGTMAEVERRGRQIDDYVRIFELRNAAQLEGSE